MSDKKLNTTTLTRVDLYGVEYTITVTGMPHSNAVRYASDDARDSMIASLAEMIAPVVAAHSFPETTRKDVADAMFPYSEVHDELSEKLHQLDAKLNSILVKTMNAAEEAAYMENAMREYLNEHFDRVHRDKIIQLLTTKQPDPVPPAA